MDIIKYYLFPNSEAKIRNINMRQSKHKFTPYMYIYAILFLVTVFQYSIF